MFMGSLTKGLPFGMTTCDLMGGRCSSKDPLTGEFPVHMCLTGTNFKRVENE